MRREEVARTLRMLGEDEEGELAERLHAMTNALVKKLLHQPTVELRSGDNTTDYRVALRLFGGDDQRRQPALTHWTSSMAGVTVRVGTRGSRLALIQTELTLAVLREAHPDVQFRRSSPLPRRATPTRRLPWPAWDLGVFRQGDRASAGDR